jgi:sortase A
VLEKADPRPGAAFGIDDDAPYADVDQGSRPRRPPAAAPRARRPSRFDRPKQPHDWRWVVGGIGRVLISTGILMFGFVAYQLWGTALQTAAAQDRLGSEFDDRVESLTTLPFPGDGRPTPSVVPAPATTIVTADTSAAPGATAAPTDSTAAPSIDPATTGVPASPLDPVTAPPSPLATPEPLDVVARLEIESIGADHYVVEGVTRNALKKGPGHFPETPLPGQLGNAAIAGHRTTFGAPFGDIDEIRPGDDIKVTVPGAGTYYYVVDATVIVAPEDYASVVPTLDVSRATLTLVSCHPEYSTKQRIIVTAELDPSRSNIVTRRSAPGPSDSGASLPTEGALAPSLEAPAGLRSGGGSSRIVLPVLPTALAESPGSSSPAWSASSAPGSEESEDAFSAGWFSDDAAWPHVAGWGTLLTLIALGSYWVSCRTRRNVIGALVGIVPFVVVLYFFYENVNRLLPPAL